MDELTWYRTKNAARRLLKNRMRAAVAKAKVASDSKWSPLVGFEEGAVQEAQEAYREVLASWASPSTDPDEFRDMLQIALAEAADHVREHYDEGIACEVVDRVLDQFMTDFDPEELLPCPS